MKKKKNWEDLFYLFITISPILDALSCIYRKYVPGVGFNPIIIIRFMIPGFLFLHLFLKEGKVVKKRLLLLGLIYLLYGVIHVLIVQKLFTSISYGTMKMEIQYLLNYTFNIVLLIVATNYTKNHSEKLNKSLFYMLLCYLGIIYFSIFTKTSFPTYIEGTGYRSYFTSGNSISTVLLLLLCTLIPSLSKKNLQNYFALLLLGIYLVFLVGTRTGLFGFFLVVGTYIIISIFYSFLHKKKIQKKYLIVGSLLILSTIIILTQVGSSTLTRRKQLREESGLIVDVNTGNIAHVTGDTSVLVWKINHKEIELPKDVESSILGMYNRANKWELNCNNNRLQQWLYHTYLIKNQKNITTILFGNGHVNHGGELILEMELFSLLYNFGILGFCIYLCPFLYLFYKALKRKWSKEHIMNLFACSLAFGLSMFAGYVFFSTTCVLVLICILMK